MYWRKIFEDVGYTDSFREKNPNPLKKPGITWDNKMRIDSHRIDYIFYMGKNLKAIKSDSFASIFWLNALREWKVWKGLLYAKNIIGLNIDNYMN